MLFWCFCVSLHWKSKKHGRFRTPKHTLTSQFKLKTNFIDTFEPLSDTSWTLRKTPTAVNQKFVRSWIDTSACLRFSWPSIWYVDNVLYVTSSYCRIFMETHTICTAETNKNMLHSRLKKRSVKHDLLGHGCTISDQGLKKSSTRQIYRKGHFRSFSLHH